LPGDDPSARSPRNASLRASNGDSPPSNRLPTEDRRHRRPFCPNASRFDPKTESFQTFPILPSGGGVVRNMMPTMDGKAIVMAESAANKVAIAYIE